MSELTKDKIVSAMLAVIARDGWPATTLEAIAREAACSVADVAVHGNRFNLLAAFGKATDIAALKAADADGGSQAPRDRLFDIFMARFDALDDHKSAIKMLGSASRRDPGLAAFFVCRLPRSMEQLASAAGVTTSGLLGTARVKALAALYLGVVRVWLTDDSEDMAKTMAALDKALARAHSWEARVQKYTRTKPDKSMDAAAPA
jgi:AcrR family transcriptional regulator